MLFTVGPMLLGILPVLISTINKVYNNNNNKSVDKNEKENRTTTQTTLEIHRSMRSSIHGWLSSSRGTSGKYE